MELLSQTVYLAGDGGPNAAFTRLKDQERVPGEVQSAVLGDCVKFVCGGFHCRKEVDCNNGNAFSEMFLGVSARHPSHATNASRTPQPPPHSI